LRDGTPRQAAVFWGVFATEFKQKADLTQIPGEDADYNRDEVRTHVAKDYPDHRPKDSDAAQPGRISFLLPDPAIIADITEDRTGEISMPPRFQWPVDCAAGVGMGRLAAQSIAGVC